jgi:hypothetical protein
MSVCGQLLLLSGYGLSEWVSHLIYHALCALLLLIVCALAAGPSPCPHDCNYYSTAPGCSSSNFHCLRNGQLHEKALGTGFVGMYGPTQSLGRADQ